MKTAFRASFLNDIAKLVEEALRRRVQAIIGEVESARSLAGVHNIKKLKIGTNCYRIRVGDF